MSQALEWLGDRVATVSVLNLREIGLGGGESRGGGVAGGYAGGEGLEG